MDREPVQVDGARGEGGGQILRTAVSLAVILGRPAEIANIRAGRARPGLQPQHLASVRAAARLCAAELSGDAAGSRFLRFVPRAPVAAGEYRFEIATAGAAPLLAQTVLPPLAWAAGASGITVTGGTHVPHAPTAEYLEAVYLPALERGGLEARCASPEAGFYPRGGGRLEIQVRAQGPTAAFHLSDRGRLLELRALVVTAGLPEHVGLRGAAAVERTLRSVGRRVETERRERPSPGPGAAVVLAARCEGGFAGFTALGERGRPMEKVAENACEQFMRWWKSGAACDEHLADQLVLPAALAAGESRWTTPLVTEHLRTVLEVVRLFLPVEAEISGGDGGPAEVCVRGVGRAPA